MFIRQAGRQFELFTGSPAPLDYMAETLLKSMSVVRKTAEPEKPAAAESSE
jgi:hypothetical protein